MNASKLTKRVVNRRPHAETATTYGTRNCEDSASGRGQRHENLCASLPAEAARQPSPQTLHNDRSARRSDRRASRSQAQILLGRVAKGEDSAAQISSQKEALAFEELADRFLQEHVRSKRKPRTAEFYETLLRKHALPTLGRRSAQTVTRSDIAKLHSAMAKTPHNANRLVAAVGSLYSYTGKHGLVSEGYNPARGNENTGRKDVSGI